MNDSVAALMIIIAACLVYFYHIKLHFSSIQAELSLYRDNSDALRGIAIFTVVTHHLVQELQNPGLLLPYRGLGYLSVAVFFLLSGYGLGKGYQDICRNTETRRSYWKKRLLKVYLPLLVIECSLYIVWCCIYGAEYVLRDMIKYIFHEWYIQMLTVWYILFYLIYCFFKNRKMRVILHLFASILIVAVCAYMGLPKSYFDTAFCFTIGIFWAEYQEEIYTIVEKEGKKLFIVAIALTAFFMIKGYQETDILTLSFRTLSTITFAVAVGIISYYLDMSGNRIAIAIGRSSFVIYLLHYMLLLTLLEKCGFGVWMVICYYGILIIGGLLGTKCMKAMNQSTIGNKRKN